MDGRDEGDSVSDTVLGDNPTYGGIQTQCHTELKEMANIRARATEHSEDNTCTDSPTMASTLLHDVNCDHDRSLTMSGSHSYEYVTTTDYLVQQEPRYQAKGQGRLIEESAESSGVYYSIEYTRSGTTGVQLLQIKPAASRRDQLPARNLIRTQSSQAFIPGTSIPQHYETMDNTVLSHNKIMTVSVNDSVTLHPDS